MRVMLLMEEERGRESQAAANAVRLLAAGIQRRLLWERRALVPKLYDDASWKLLGSVVVF